MARSRLARVSFVVALALTAWLRPVPAAAVPQYSLQTGLQCDACHESVRATTGLGDYYIESDYRFPNLGIHRAPVVALRGRAVYASDGGDEHLPKATIEALEAFLSARVSPQVSATVESYAVDEGVPGALREAWVQYMTPRKIGTAPGRLTIGLQGLPLPVDPEAFRQTTTPYAIFEQHVGESPFSLVQPKNAVQLGLGSLVRGASVAAMLAEGHDPSSGLATHGVDRMLEAQYAAGGAVIGGYVYKGARGVDGLEDGFRRSAVFANGYRGRLALETLAQRGDDVDPLHGVVRSSGGFVQLRYQFASGDFALARYDRANDQTGDDERSVVIGFTHPLGRWLHLGAEDRIHSRPTEGHELRVSLGFGVTNTRLGSGAY
jgi:hypothetical protein